MENFCKILANQANIIALIAIIEAIILVILLLYVVHRRLKVKDERRKMSILSDDKDKKDKEIELYKSEYNKIYRELIALKKTIEKNSNERDAKLNQEKSNLSNNQKNNSERTNQSDNDYSDYIAKEKEKGVYVKETKNDDGTIKSEINFDLSDDGLASVSVPPKYDYLEAANGGQFRKLLTSDEKCFFRTWEENGTRKFEFYGNVDKALANINAIFDDVCEIEGKQNGASNIINVEPGVLDSKLKVEKPAKIKLL